MKSLVAVITFILLVSCSHNKSLYHTNLGYKGQKYAKNIFKTNIEYDTVFGLNNTIVGVDKFDRLYYKSKDREVLVIAKKGKKVDTLTFHNLDYVTNNIKTRIDFFSDLNRKNKLFNIKNGYQKLELDKLSEVKKYSTIIYLDAFPFDCLVRPKKTKFKIKVISNGEAILLRNLHHFTYFKYKKGDVVIFYDIESRIECSEESYKQQPVVIEII